MRFCVKIRREDPIWNQEVKRLEQYGETHILVENVVDADVLLGTNITANDINNMPNLKHIFLAKTGADALPMKLINERNIGITTSHACAGLVAEHAIALAMTLTHQIIPNNNMMATSIWPSTKTFLWKSLANMNIGILGMGYIGCEIKQQLKGIVRGQFYALDGHGIKKEDIVYVSSVEELVRASDILFICVPLNETTNEMINEITLQNASDLYIVNVSRFGICNENALYAALNNGQLAGFASDVWLDEIKSNQDEEWYTNTGLEKLPNVVMSPHVGMYAPEGHELYVRDCVSKCITFARKNLYINNLENRN